MSKHTQPVNYLDFKQSKNLCASCSDDGSVIIYNYGSYRQEGHLIGEDISEVKVCKFLGDYDCLVSSDIEGMMYFWAITPSPRKGELLCTVENENESEVGTITTFPIKGIDFDEEARLIFTGDEMGYMHKWDISDLIDKLEEVAAKEGKPALK